MDALQKSQSFLKTMRGALFDEDTKFIVGIMLKVVGNVIKFPGVEKYRDIKAANKSFLKCIQMYPPALGLLEIAGFEVKMVNMEERYYLDLMREDPARVEAVLTALKESAKELKVEPLPTVDKYKPGALEQMRTQRQAMSNGFDPFKSNITSNSHVPVTGGGNLKMENKVAQLEKKIEDQIKSAGIPERQIGVYPQGAGLKSAPPLLSEKGDGAVIRKALADKRKQNQKNSTLRTEAMRKLDKLKRQKVYLVTKIRVVLPDRSIIDANYSPLETIADVKKIVAGCIKNASEHPFNLLNPEPPRRKLEDTHVLREFQAAAKLHLTWTGAAPSGDYLFVVKPLSGGNEFPEGIKAYDEEEDPDNKKKKKKSRQSAKLAKFVKL